jgi:Putative peptidoglycan binding domain
MAMSKGDRGPGVWMLQDKLDLWIQGVKEQGGSTGLIGVTRDKSFGSNTQVALAAYQKACGMSPTGHADAFTLETLGLPPDLEAGSIVTEGGGI